MSEETGTHTSTTPSSPGCCNHTCTTHASQKRTSLLLGVVIGVLGALLLGCMHHSHAAEHSRINDAHHRHLHHMQMSEHFGQMDHMRHMAPMHHRMGEMMERMAPSEQRSHRGPQDKADAGDSGVEAETAASLPSED